MRPQLQVICLFCGVGGSVQHALQHLHMQRVQLGQQQGPRLVELALATGRLEKRIQATCVLPDALLDGGFGLHALLQLDDQLLVQLAVFRRDVLVRNGPCHSNADAKPHHGAGIETLRLARAHPHPQRRVYRRALDKVHLQDDNPGPAARRW